MPRQRLFYKKSRKTALTIALISIRILLFLRKQLKNMNEESLKEFKEYIF